MQLRRQHPTRPHTVDVAEPNTWASPACAAANLEHRAGAIAEYAVRLASRPDLLALACAQCAGKDVGCYCPAELPCHRDVLVDFAHRCDNPHSTDGHALAVTVARPWASLTLLPEQLSPTLIHHRSWSTDYRGALCIIGAQRLDDAGVQATAAAGFDATWHAAQTGWLGAAVLVDVHPARRDCCPPWGRPARHRSQRLYHWVFRRGARLARRVPGRGFRGLRAVSWAVLLRRDAPTASPIRALSTAEVNTEQ
ncbi:DUF4326 domain-containing protein [Mycobacterium lehmannii]|uniref:DUF4326 domain-containing protein n=1 Tax=Mycobacterium lehmannii TaxID=2048550 RepID=UPI0013046798|nr:DUF4326 domain-containing protein [Mycobacterium lehmannii]